MNPFDMTVFVTDDAEMIQAIKDYEAAEDAWREAHRALLVEWGLGNHHAMVSSFAGTKTWKAITVEDKGSEVPIGWKLDRKNWHLTPLKKSREGKAIATQMDACQPPRAIKLTGMLNMHMDAQRGNLYMLHAHPVLIQDRLYAVWNTGNLPDVGVAEGASKELIDPALWTKVKASEFVALVEAENERREAVAAQR